MSSVAGRSFEAPFPPTWLCDFAREIRCRLSPILARDRQGVWAPLVRWRDTHNEQSRLHFEWQTRRGEAALPRLNALPGSIWPERPVVGRVWNAARIDRVGEAHDGEPSFDSPLPPPENRDPTADECVAAMIAIHDEVRDPRERIGPDVGDGAGDEWWPFQLLRSCVRWLTEAHLAALHRMLETAVANLNTDGGGGADPDPDPQYVTLDQLAAIVNRSKKTLERELSKDGSPMPTPDVVGGGGKPHEWKWSRIRPWLESTYGRQLPVRFPAR